MVDDLSQAIKLRDLIAVAVVGGELDRDAGGVEPEPNFHGFDDVFAAIAAQRRDAQRPGIEVAQPGALPFVQLVALVEHIDGGDAIGTDLRQNGGPPPSVARDPGSTRR